MFDNKIFSNRISKLRKAHGLKQSELGAVIGINKNAVSMLETGARTTTFEVLLSIAEYFDVPTDYLLGAGLYKHAEQIEEHYDYIKNFISNIIIDEKPNLIEDYIQNLDACENIVDRIALLSIFIKKISFDNNEIRIHLKLYK